MYLILYNIYFSVLRDKVTNQDLMNLVNEMAENASKNPYLFNALESFKNGNYPNLKTKLMQEGSIVIPRVITFAFVLEKMTSTMLENWRFLKVCNEIWLENDNFKKILDIVLPTEGGIFKVAKVLTIDESFNRVLRQLETRDIRKVTLH